MDAQGASPTKAKMEDCSPALVCNNSTRWDLKHHASKEDPDAAVLSSDTKSEGADYDDKTGPTVPPSSFAHSNSASKPLNMQTLSSARTLDDDKAAEFLIRKAMSATGAQTVFSYRHGAKKFIDPDGNVKEGKFGFSHSKTRSLLRIVSTKRWDIKKVEIMQQNISIPNIIPLAAIARKWMVADVASGAQKF